MLTHAGATVEVVPCGSDVEPVRVLEPGCVDVEPVGVLVPGFVDVEPVGVPDGCKVVAPIGSSKLTLIISVGSLCVEVAPVNVPPPLVEVVPVKDPPPCVEVEPIGVPPPLVEVAPGN